MVSNGETRAAFRKWFFLIVIAIAILRYLVSATKLVIIPLWLGLMVAYPKGMFLIGSGLLVYTLHQLWNSRGEVRILSGEAALCLFALVIAVRAFAEIGPYDFNIFYGVPLLLVFMITLSKCVGLAAVEFPVERRRHLQNSALAAEVAILAVSAYPPNQPPDNKISNWLGSDSTLRQRTQTRRGKSSTLCFKRSDKDGTSS